MHRLKTKFGVLFSTLFIASTSLLAQNPSELEQHLKNYDHLAQSRVMVIGTHHFGKSVLEKKNQESIETFVQLLSGFKPTKIVLEWEPSKTDKTNENYKAYLKDDFLIDDKANEVYQLGFRLAKLMEHDQLYLFDDKTPFIGSLDNFSFESFNAYASKNDSGFYDKYIDDIGHNYNYNREYLKSLSLKNEIILRNSPSAQKINSQRMHAFEVRVGIQESWIGPDWLGRWYRRNVRMLANLIKLNEPNDNILIIVGDNHKWVLDDLVESTPEFKLVSSWEFLTNQTK